MILGRGGGDEQQGTQAWGERSDCLPPHRLPVAAFPAAVGGGREGAGQFVRGPS